MIRRIENGTDYELCKTGTYCGGYRVVLYWCGFKSQTVKDKYIPLVLGGCGIVICAVYVFATCQCRTSQEIAMAIFVTITQGILVAGLSTYINQIVKQSKKAE